MDSTEYNDVFKEDRGALNYGRFKLTNQFIVFKNAKTGKVEQLNGTDINNINWQRITTGYGLRIIMKNGHLYRFGGFIEADHDKLNKFFSQNYDIELKTKDFSLKGWNWGTAKFDGAALSFDVDKSGSAFEVPLTNVSHCTTAKNEVTLEFHQNDDAAVSLMELRFHIPTQADGVTDDPVSAFMEQVLAKASIIQATGDAIVTFSELQCLTPRGRYDIKMFPSFIQLHGKTFDYKIPLTSILRLFRLPHKDNRQVFFVLSLDPPIKQGQTRYHFLILLFNKEEEITVELSLTEKDAKEKYDGKLEKTMSGPTIDILGRLMKVLVQRKITTPGDFVGTNQSPVISCSYKAGAGLLYPLDRGFIYIHKPPIHIRFDEISAINFARSGGSTRSFDFEVETKLGVTHTFSSIEKEEYSKLYDFVTKKKLRVKNRGTENTKTDTVDDDLVDSDLEDEPDAYLARVKQEGKIRVEGGDDSDESDESFAPDGGGSDSDVAEEYDSNAGPSSSSGDEEDGTPKIKKEKEKPKSKPPKEKDETKVKKKRAKKEKDSNKPKKPLTSYFLWLNENREKLKKENPGLSLTELTKKAAEIWREKTPDKSKWEKENANDKKRYEKEMAEYKASGGGSEPSTSKKKTKKKESSEDSKKERTKSKVSPVKSSGSFKSKEYISDDDSSSEDEKNKKSKKKDESDVEMSSGSD